MKIFRPNKPEAWLVMIVFGFATPIYMIGLAIFHFIERPELIGVKIIGAISFISFIGFWIGFRFVTTKYIVDGEKFKYHRIFGLAKTEGYIKDIYRWTPGLAGISTMVLMRNYKGNTKMIFVSMRRKKEAELVKLILEKSPDMKIDYKFYKLVKKYYGLDYSNNIIEGSYPFFFE